MISTEEELKTRKKKNLFVDPFDLGDEVSEEERAEYWDSFLSYQYGEEVRIHRNELAKKKEEATRQR